MNGVSPTVHKVVVEFSSPNLGKAFDGLHLRSTVIGAFIASIYESMGWKVQRVNFLGDTGKHIGLLLAGWARFGSDEALDADALSHLLEVFTRTEAIRRREPRDAHMSEIKVVEAEQDEWFTKLESGAPDVLALWNRLREASVTRYAKLYIRLGINFDDYSGESHFSKETLAEIEDTLTAKGVYTQTDEGWMIEFSKPGEKGFGSRKLRFNDGTTTYLLRDIAAVLERKKKSNFDRMIYVVSAKQTTHFQQVFKTLELMGHSDLASQLVHHSFGDVQGIVPREGSNGLLLDDILDQVREVTQKALSADQDTSGHFFGHDPASVAETVGTANITINDFLTKRAAILNFNLEKMIAEGEHTGLSLQKSYATLSSKLRGVDIDRAELEIADHSLFEDADGEGNVYAEALRLLLQFPGTVRTSFEKLEPSYLVTYLFSIVDMSSMWEDELEDGSSQSLVKLALYECLRQTMENGMKTLGLCPLTT